MSLFPSRMGDCWKGLPGWSVTPFPGIGSARPGPGMNGNWTAPVALNADG